MPTRFRLALPFAFTGLAVAALARGQDAPLRDWQSAAQQLDRAVLDGNVAGIRSARGELLRMLDVQRSGESGAWLHYTVAYGSWRLVYLPTVAKTERGTLLDDAVRHLETAMKLKQPFAEAEAMLGSIYGSQIAQEPWRGMFLGQRAGRALERAAKAAPDNPRVVLQQGLSAYFTPAMFGGGLDRAEERLRRALALFDREAADGPWPNWGRFDAHVWLAQLLAKRGDRGAARAEYERALAIAPRSSWVREALLPALDRAKAQ